MSPWYACFIGSLSLSDLPIHLQVLVLVSDTVSEHVSRSVLKIQNSRNVNYLFKKATTFLKTI